LVSFTAIVKESDLFIRAQRNLKQKALKATSKCRTSLENYIRHSPSFLTALKPIPVAEDAPQVVKEMTRAAEKVGVGPMAAVAGAIAEYVGRELLPLSSQVIVENGGDLFLKVSQRRFVGIYAGESPFTGRVALEIEPEETPLGICTSSGTVGHSLSFGTADAVIVLSPSTALADTAATAIGNIIKEASAIPRGIEFAQGIEGIKGVVIIKGSKIGLWGKVRLSDVSTLPR
jgi:hypothetical protein